MKTVGNSDSLSPVVTASVLNSTDLDATIFEIDDEAGPLIEGIGAGFAQIAIGKGAQGDPLDFGA